ncbi:MAG: lipid-A-disaccharide synthase [Bacteroidetes bacterium]|nr:lipid-A-disaccharide synthase [Bacteroidota bacterium]
MKTIFIVAGDQSGDSHAAKLMRELSLLHPSVKFIGIGGIEMSKAGLQSIVPLSEISVVGFWEVAKRYFYFRQLLSKCEQLLLTSSVDCFIPVDYPGFNIRLATFAKKNNIPVYYYIAPQLWAWGKTRAQKLASIVDKLLVVFPFEVNYFAKYGINTEFVGHPLLDNKIFSLDCKREYRIALLPGSRLQEIKKHIPIMRETVAILEKKLPDIKIGIAVSPIIDQSIYKKLIPNSWEIFTDSRLLMKTSTIGIIKTGTSTLEAALCELPFVMIYKTSLISFHLSKYLIKLPFVSLVNILMNKKIVQELIQNDAEPKRVVYEILDLLTISKSVEMKGEFEKLRTLLGNPGASKRAAESIYNLLHDK